MHTLKNTTWNRSMKQGSHGFEQKWGGCVRFALLPGIKNMTTFRKCAPYPTTVFWQMRDKVVQTGTGLRRILCESECLLRCGQQTSVLRQSVDSNNSRNREILSALHGRHTLPPWHLPIHFAQVGRCLKHDACTFKNVTIKKRRGRARCAEPVDRVASRKYPKYRVVSTGPVWTLCVLST